MNISLHLQHHGENLVKSVDTSNVHPRITKSMVWGNSGLGETELHHGDSGGRSFLGWASRNDCNVFNSVVYLPWFSNKAVMIDQVVTLDRIFSQVLVGKFNMTFVVFHGCTLCRGCLCQFLSGHATPLMLFDDHYIITEDACFQHSWMCCGCSVKLTHRTCHHAWETGQQFYLDPPVTHPKHPQTPNRRSRDRADRFMIPNSWCMAASKKDLDAAQTIS